MPQLYYAALTVDKTKVTADVTDVPAVFTTANLPADMLDADGAKKALEDGGDLRFYTDVARTTQLAADIIRFTQDNTPANAKAEIRVKCNLSSATNTVIYVFWGDSSLSMLARTNTYGQDNAYASGFKVLCPMRDGTTSTVIDRTVNQNTGAKRAANGPATTASGQVNDCQDFTSGNSDTITFTAVNHGSDFTVFSSFYSGDLGDKTLSESKGNNSNNDGYGIYIAAPSLYVRGSGGGYCNWNASLATNTWTDLAIKCAGTVANYFKDGGTKSSNGTIAATGNGNVLYSGWRGWSSNYWAGKIDNFILFVGTLADDTIRTMQNNQVNIGTFSSAGATQDVVTQSIVPILNTYRQRRN